MTDCIKEEKGQYKACASSAFFDASGQTNSCSRCRGLSTTSSIHIILISERTCSMPCYMKGKSDSEMSRHHKCWLRRTKRNSKEFSNSSRQWCQMPSLGFRRGCMPRTRMEVKAHLTHRWGCRAACLASTQAHNSKWLRHQRCRVAKSNWRIRQKQERTKISRNENLEKQARQMDLVIYRSSFKQHMLIFNTARIVMLLRDIYKNKIYNKLN